MSEFDKAFLAYYQSRTGACAHYCANSLKTERADVSRSLQRLKKRGLMVTDGTYWKVKP